MIINAESRQGFAFEFTETLNKSQHEYNFKLQVLPSKRLIKRVEAKNFDALFFMAINWLPKSSHSYLTKTSTSVTIKNEFYALKENAHDQSYFIKFNELTKAGVLGYSYSFADYNTDASFLNKVHKMSLTKSGSHVVKMILLKRAEVGIINNLTFEYLKKTNSFDMDLLYKSQTPDATFETSFLMNNLQAKLSTNKFEQIMNHPKTKKRLKSLFTKYGIPSSVN